MSGQNTALLVILRVPMFGKVLVIVRIVFAPHLVFTKKKAPAIHMLNAEPRGIKKIVQED